MFSSNEDKILKPGQVWHGVAVGWHDDVHADFEYIPSNNTRFVGIRITLKTGRILSISLYAPTSGKDDDFLECITDLTEYILSNISAGDRVLIGTDSNCSTKSTQEDSSAGELSVIHFLFSHTQLDPQPFTTTMAHLSQVLTCSCLPRI